MVSYQSTTSPASRPGSGLPRMPKPLVRSHQAAQVPLSRHLPRSGWPGHDSLKEHQKATGDFEIRLIARVVESDEKLIREATAGAGFVAGAGLTGPALRIALQSLGSCPRHRSCRPAS